MKKKNIYVVVGYRWGNRESHSYICGVFNKKAKAQDVADDSFFSRGGKYSFTVQKFTVNEKEIGREIYRAGS